MANSSVSLRSNGKPLRSFSGIILALLGVLLVKAWLSSGTLWFIRDGQLFVQDFFYHLQIYDAFYRGVIHDPYLASEQSQVMRALSGLEHPFIMPIGQSPIAVFFFAPFVMLFRISPAVAYCAWTFCSLGVLAIGLLKFAKGHSTQRQKVMLIVLSATLFSAVGIRAVVLGQTTLFALGILLILAVELLRSGMPRPYLVGLLLFGLAIKPPYFLIALPLIASIPRGNAVKSLGTLGLASTVIGLLQPQLWPSYFIGIPNYTLRVEPQYIDSLRFETMTIFKTFVVSLFPGALAFPFALLTFAVAGIGLFFFLLLRSSWMVKAVLSVAWVLLFLPVLGRYEDLLLLFPILICVCEGAVSSFVAGSLLAMMLILFVNLEAAGSTIFALAGFPLKLCLCAYLLNALKFAPKNSHTN